MMLKLSNYYESEPFSPPPKKNSTESPHVLE